MMSHLDYELTGECVFDDNVSNSRSISGNFRRQNHEVNGIYRGLPYEQILASSNVRSYGREDCVRHESFRSLADMRH